MSVKAERGDDLTKNQQKKRESNFLYQKQKPGTNIFLNFNLKPLPKYRKFSSFTS